LTNRPEILSFLSIVVGDAGARQASGTGVEADRRATLRLIIALGRALQALERGVRPHLAQFGLGMTEFAVLEVLYHKGTLPLGQIRDRILVTGASTTYVVKRLEERGLLRRKACAGDDRKVLGELTPKGRTLIQEAFPAHVERLRHLMGGLSAPEKDGAIVLLRRLGQHARRTTGERITEED
jgi:MarR family transcriptional regulator, 2-MHQ and catechol-resistance regulon repressor